MNLDDIVPSGSSSQRRRSSAAGRDVQREIGSLAHTMRERMNVEIPAGRGGVADQDRERRQDKDKPAGMRGVARNESVYVTLPEGIKAGQTIKTQAPDGHIFKFTVPAGVKGGDMVQVEVPPQDQRQSRTVKVKVPKGCRSGDEMMAKAPDGTPFTCVIPPGYGPGDILSFELQDDTQPKTKIPEQPLAQNSMNSSGQFVVKVPIEARPGQVVYDRTGFGDIFSYVVPANATPDELTTVWPIGVDQASYSGREKLKPQQAMSARKPGGKKYNAFEDMTADDDGTVSIDRVFDSIKSSPSSSGASLNDAEKTSNDSFHTAKSTISCASPQPQPPRRRKHASKEKEGGEGKKAVFVTSHHLGAASISAAAAREFSSAPTPGGGMPMGEMGMGRRRGSMEVGSSVMAMPSHYEPLHAPAGAASVPPPDYSDSDDNDDEILDGDVQAGRNP